MNKTQQMEREMEKVMRPSEVNCTAEVERRNKHLFIIDEVQRLDIVIEKLSRLIQQLKPTDEKTPSAVGGDLEDTPLVRFLEETPEYMHNKTQQILKQIEIVNELLF